MTVRKLRAALAAIVLGTAAIGAGAVVLPTPAQAATVSHQVGAVLQEAQTLANAGNYRGAMAKVNEAEGVPGKTPDDTAVINQMKKFIAVKSGDASVGGVDGALAKFSNDYNAGKYRDAIADAETLRKYNALTPQNQLIIGQAYYKVGDFAGCVRYAKTLAGSDTALELQARCAYEIGDEVTQRQALEALVGRTGKPEYWTGLLKLGERARGLSDHNTLDINRLRLLTGSMKTKDDYISLGQFAMQFTFGAEAQVALQKGVDAKLLTDERSLRLLGNAKAMAAAKLAGRAKELATANASPQGDLLLLAGEDMIGEGKAKEAVGVIQNGLKKPLKDPNNGQIRLGQALLAAGQKAEAKAAFAKVKAPEKDAMVAHLWSLAVR
jgi:tetratricopeptide (TPR) repeat protein